MAATSEKALVRALYGQLFRLARSLKTEPALNNLTIRRPIDERLYGRGYALPRPALDWRRRILFGLLAPSLVDVPLSGIFTYETLRHCLRANFRLPVEETKSSPDRIDLAFQALRVLQDQFDMQRAASITSTDGILVEAISKFIPSSNTDLQTLTISSASDPSDPPPSYFFVYRMRIENHTTETIQLDGRHLQFFDGNGRLVVEVPRFSEGVVGLHPMIGPGDAFEYMSGSTLPTPSGAVLGSFQCYRLKDGVKGEARKTSASLLDAHFGPLMLKSPNTG